MGFSDWVKGIFSKEEEPSYDVIACARCGIEYPEDVMHPEGSVVFCNDCVEKQKTEQEELERKRRQMSRVAVYHYKCGDCRFSFKRKDDFNLKMCPNCGGQNFFAEGRSYK